MDARSTGALVIAIGVGVVIIGALMMAGALGWLGRLPGDIRIERENVRVYVPIATMLVISVAISLVLWLVRRG